MASYLYCSFIHQQSSHVPKKRQFAASSPFHDFKFEKPAFSKTRRPQIRRHFPHICRVLHSLHPSLSSTGPNMVLHQAGCIWLFSYKVMNTTLSLNRIAPREIRDMIRYTFLTSLSCGCVEH